MKKAICLVLAVMVVLFASTLPGYGAHIRGGVWIGPGWGVWGPWWWGPPVYPYYYPQPPVVQQQPPAYVQPAPLPEEQYYWYFCPNPQGYYPYVKKCPKGWLKVIPPAPPDEEE